MANYIIYGGSFDPIHNGHLRIARAASLKLNADVIFVPARSPRWKECEASGEDRLKMMKLVLRLYAPAGSQISEYELKSTSEVNYTIDTISYFYKKYPKSKLYLLIGGDQVNKFPEWKDAELLARLTQIVYVPRPGVLISEDIVYKYNMINLNYLESGEVSSTAVRLGMSLDLPKEVLNYIEKHRLYYVKKVSEYVDEKRLNHSIEVAKLAYQIAVVNNLPNPAKYYFTGLFHDIGKLANYGKIDPEKVMKEKYKDYLDMPRFAYHQFIGEYILINDFHIKDKEILDAVKFHCTGCANMSELGMVVYAADKIEPTRQFDSRFLINSCMKNWKQGFLDTLKDNRKYLLAHAKDIKNRLTDECFKMYLGD